MNPLLKINPYATSGSEDEDMLNDALFDDSKYGTEHPESIIDLEEEQEKLLEQADPCENTKKEYGEYTLKVELQPKHWTNLSIIPVSSLLKLMSDASHKHRCEIKLPSKLSENSAKESPYGIVTRAMDHLLRDMMEDLLAIRNHRLECLKTTDLLTENGGNDDDNLNDDTMSIEDVRKLMAGDHAQSAQDTSTTSLSTWTDKEDGKNSEPVQLRVVRIREQRDKPKLFVKQCLDRMQQNKAMAKQFISMVERKHSEITENGDDGANDLASMSELFVYNQLSSKDGSNVEAKVDSLYAPERFFLQLRLVNKHRIYWGTP